MLIFFSGRFCKYDFGEVKNLEIYGQTYPPSYEINNIHVPVATYWGDNDWLAEPTVSNGGYWPRWFKITRFINPLSMLEINIINLLYFRMFSSLLHNFPI